MNTHQSPQLLIDKGPGTLIRENTSCVVKRSLLKESLSKRCHSREAPKKIPITEYVCAHAFLINIYDQHLRSAFGSMHSVSHLYEASNTHFLATERSLLVPLLAGPERQWILEVLLPHNMYFVLLYFQNQNPAPYVTFVNSIQLWEKTSQFETYVSILQIRRHDLFVWLIV